jgi:MFS family permease
VGNQICGRLLRRYSPRAVIAGAAALGSIGALVYVLAGHTGLLLLGTPIFGVAIGIATTAAYTAASSVIPPAARGAGFGLLTTASLTGLALSPILNGLLGAVSIRAVFLLDAAALLVLATMVRRLMVTSPMAPARTPAAEEF